MQRRLTIMSTLAAVVVAIAAPVVPADAATGTTLSGVTAPEPGRVTGTVTSDAAFVRVSLAAEAYDVPDEVRPVPSDTHTVSFSLATWGFPDSTTVSVAPCAGQEPWSCSPAADSETFDTGNPTPSVTWPAATKVGPQSGPYSVAVSDPDGGGVLVAMAEVEGRDDEWVGALDRSGATDLSMPDGHLHLYVQRCAEAGAPCHRYPGIGADVGVNLRVNGSVGNVSPQFVGPDHTSAPDVDVQLYVGEGADLTVRLHVQKWATGQDVPGFERTFSGLDLDAQGAVTLPVDLTGLASGNYEFSGTISYDDPDFGHLEGPLTGSSVVVDSSSPTIGSVRASPATFYPVEDGYRDTVALRTEATDNNYFRSRYEIRNSRGTVVRVLTTGLDAPSNEATWNGKVKGGSVAPAGRYRIRTTVTDQYGNSSVDDSASVTLSSKRLVTKTFTRTVTARGSLVDKYVGSCSTLALPAAGRGWGGSMGLYTATRCRGTVKKTLVSTTHALRVPTALRYGTLRVTAYGGAARSAARSLAYLTYYHGKDGWKNDRAMSPATGSHRGAGVRATPYVLRDRSVAWGAYTAKGARYDVRGFTVSLTYTLLR